MDSYTEVLTWGSNTYGQMGLEANNSPSPSPRICSFGILLIQVACGREHSAFLSTQHLIYTMGSNSDGRLGIGDKTTAYSSCPLLVETLAGTRVTSISCGAFHSAALSHSGDLFTWGKGAMLGLGDLVTRWEPTKVEIPDTYVTQVSCGTHHSGVVGLSRNERVCLTWGANDCGQLGNGCKSTCDRPTKAIVLEPKEVACGEDFSLILNTQGQVFSTGKNCSGQLGLGGAKEAIVPARIKALDNVFVSRVAAGGLSACVTEDGALFTWGLGTWVPTQLRGCPKEIQDVSVGRRFLAVITRTAAVWTWGDNARGQLGVGDTNIKESICIVNCLTKKKVKSAACGSDFIIVLGEDLKQSKGLSLKLERSTEYAQEGSSVNLSSLLDNKKQRSIKEEKKTHREQFWSSDRNEVKESEAKDIGLYESALKKMNQVIVQKEKQLQQERESRLKNEEYRKIYIELEEKLASVVQSIEFEKIRREESELLHAKNEARLLRIIRKKEEEAQALKSENARLASALQGRQPCTTCINILEEFTALKLKNESLLFQLSKKGSPSHTKKTSIGENSGLYVPQSPSFDKSLDKSMDRHKSFNNQLKISRSESELLKLIDAPIASKSPRRTDRGLDLSQLDQDEDFALPTFRNQETSFSMQKNLKTSLAEIKARITALNSNRSEIQTKMEELETKLSHPYT